MQNAEGRQRSAQRRFGSQRRLEASVDEWGRRWIFNVRAMEQVVADSLWELNLYRWLIGLFAGLVLALSAIGLYGVTSCTVAARGREFALRLALGSDQSRLACAVLSRGVRLSLIGLTIGLVVSLQLALALAPFAIDGRLHAVLVAAVSTVLIAIALAACAVPAMRVARVTRSPPFDTIDRGNHLP